VSVESVVTLDTQRFFWELAIGISHSSEERETRDNSQMHSGLKWRPRNLGRDLMAHAVATGFS